MHKILTQSLFVTFMICGVLSANATDYIADSPTRQDAVYDEATQTVVITAKAPTTTDYDWETYQYYELPYITSMVIERHTPGQVWPDDAQVAQLTDVTPGGMISWTDTDITPDARYEYRLTCYVDDVKGKSCYANVYTGVIPGALQSFTATTDSHLTDAVDFAITAPAVSASGNPLTSPVTISIQAYSSWTWTEIHTIADVQPGATATWQLTGHEMEKSYHYRACAVTGSSGNGEATEADVYVGLDVPGMPVDLKVEPSGTGAKITWQAPASGSRGGSYAPDQTTYMIFRKYHDGITEEVKRGLSATEYFDAPNLEEAITATYSVRAVNAAGEGYKDAVADVVSFGPAAKLPFVESFANAELQHRGWLTPSSQDDEYYTYKAWEFATYATMYHFPTDENLTINPQDRDGGLASCRFYSYSPDGQTEGLLSPAIEVGGVDNLTLRYFYWQVESLASNNEVSTWISRDGGEWENIHSATAPDILPNPSWKEVLLSIPVNGAQELKFRIDAIRHNGSIANVFVDNISLRDTNQSAIESITPDTDNAPKSYYNLQGINLGTEKPIVPGIYIERTANTSHKILVK